MTRPLSPMQIAILDRVQKLVRVPEDQLRTVVAQSLRRKAREQEWEKEFGLATDLLHLYRAIRIEAHPGHGRVFVDAQYDRSRGNVAQAPTPFAPTRAFGPSRPRFALPFMTSVLVAAGCTLIPAADSNAPSGAPSKSDGWPALGRIEQFFDGPNVFYRYCRADECPTRTPKSLVSSESARSADIGAQPVQQGVANASTGVTREYEQAKTVKLPAPAHPTIIACGEGPSPQPAVVAAARTAELKLDTAFDSHRGVVSFANGSMALDGMSRQKVAKLAPRAREAERVKLRGRVAAPALTEELRKLAVGRAYAVKMEFARHDVSKDKVRILYPRENDLLDGDRQSASINRSVDVMFDMPPAKQLSATVREGAQAERTNGYAD